MTRDEYENYQSSVAHFFESEGITNLSCGKNCEPYFSWSSCDCCGSLLGGDRHDVTGWNPTAKEVQEYSVCSNCVYYAEYGQLDDQTMLEIEASEKGD